MYSEQGRQFYENAYFCIFAYPIKGSIGVSRTRIQCITLNFFYYRITHYEINLTMNDATNYSAADDHILSNGLYVNMWLLVAIGLD